MRIVTTIAGSDSGGGAGIQADLKTFQELDVFGTSVITALTAQNTLGVSGVLPIEVSFIEKQVLALLEDFPLSAIKTGMLFSSKIIQVIASQIKDLEIPLIVDPVMIAKGGENLLQQEAIEALRIYLLPLATVLTPNIPEAEVLTGKKIESIADIKHAAETLIRLGVQCVVIKGGHLVDEKYATDYVFFNNGRTFSMQAKRINTKNTHGTGCTFSAALTAFIAQGLPLEQAIIEAKKFIQMAITHDLNIGNGHGPTNHFAYRKNMEISEVTVLEA
ncbi:phosphomethylpyrimidine kinase [Lysinibacillus contaminans]|uniref:Hydroxymethylpyrimidine/phosphomethylpyrimidine kinase n=1 Tax=Lysinibacillus contaminans TaxID=1293441 RepID=A0ABR5JYV7_9BACI|nr:bifunctional hydroxymethylpyrimidine kinase/phosphomethylpyrimidine kinase [Lysinibacillus contaminans]KOS67635.1 phosphomethylpyrimidine kinase [Lysinibacillus contaminans]